jgi:hypothetical protein
MWPRSWNPAEPPGRPSWSASQPLLADEERWGEYHESMATLAQTASAPYTNISSFVLTMDVERPDVSAAFYQQVLGFAEFARERDGRKLSCRLLKSELVPNVVIRLRQTLGKRVTATQPGTVSRLSFACPNLAERADGDLAFMVRLAPPTVVDGKVVSLTTHDPDGYIIELYTQLTQML